MKRFSYRNAGLIMLALAVFLIAVSGCQGRQTLTYSQLLSSPGQYNGKTVTVEGFYFDSFEFIGLCERLTVLDNGRFTPDGEVMWLNGRLPKELYDKLGSQQAELGGFVQHYGRMKVTGKFEYGGKYGHLGGFGFQITPDKVELLPPPK